jgi:hypothetical protein
VKPWNLNAGPYHLSDIWTGEDTINLDENLLDTQLFAIKMVVDYFSYIMQFLCIGMAPIYMKVVQKKKMVVKDTYYQLIIGSLYKLGIDVVLRRCLLEHERSMILEEEHDGIAGGHYARREIPQKYFVHRDLVVYTSKI